MLGLQEILRKADGTGVLCTVGGSSVWLWAEAKKLRISGTNVRDEERRWQ